MWARYLFSVPVFLINAEFMNIRYRIQVLLAALAGLLHGNNYPMICGVVVKWRDEPMERYMPRLLKSTSAG